MLDAACAWKLGSLAFKLLAGASKALDHETVATFLDIVATSIEAGEAVHDRQRDIVRAATGRLQARSSETATRGCGPNSVPIHRGERMRQRR